MKIKTILLIIFLLIILAVAIYFLIHNGQVSSIITAPTANTVSGGGQ